MKRVIRNVGSVRATAFFVLTLVGLATSSASAATPLGKSLADLESHIKWEAVDSDWKGMRDSWTEQTNACADPACVARQMAVLEEHVKWEAVAPAWKNERDSWVKECKSAKTEADVRKLILDFEENVGWKAVDGEWKGLRDGWLAAVKKG
jgi:hypothetical protein